MSGWRVAWLDDGERHVTPIGDLREHQESSGCFCHPTDDKGVWVHHSLDRREEYERGERLAS